MFFPIEVQQSAVTRKTRWIWSDGTPPSGLEQLMGVDVVSGYRSSIKEVKFRIGP